MSTLDKWEDGSLGRSLEHAAISEGSKKEVDDALGLQLISIRLQKQLVNDLKKIADYHAIGYQPMIRDLLNRFARSEIKAILSERLRQIEDDSASAEESTQPVRDFLEKMRA